MNDMQFIVIPNSVRAPDDTRNVFILHTDNWNDWFKYQTLYQLTYYDSEGEGQFIGSIKIGQFGMLDDQSRPALPENFATLDDRFFSLGQDADFYSTLMTLENNLGAQVFEALNDIAANEDLYVSALEEDVTTESLLRYVNVGTLKGQFGRIIAGGEVLTKYGFRYTAPVGKLEHLTCQTAQF